MARPVTLEVCRQNLFKDADEIPAAYQERVMRIRVGYAQWYEFPTKSEMQIRDFLMAEFKIQKSAAYEDIQIIKILLGDIKNPGKEWIRFQVSAMFDRAYEIAESDGDSKAMTLAADKKAKYFQLHLPDADPLPFDEIIPQPFEPTDDPTPLGLKKDPEIREKKRKMLEKYAGEIEITDVPYDEISLNQDEADEAD